VFVLPSRIIYEDIIHITDDIRRHRSTKTRMYNDQSKLQSIFISSRIHAQPMDDFLMIDDDIKYLNK
jgi:hypothetical protein